MIGSTLSHYRIDAELGRGGMGIVYKAVDTHLDRIVAIKVLPSSALGGQTERARFYREAKAAAQLHHPHIASIFAIEEAVFSQAPSGSAPQPFIAMEFIDGETLENRISGGPLPLDVALKAAIQVGSALEAAHDKGIVHRDIKSANVMLTKKGEAKVLDFGLAKMTQATQITQEGATMGTVAYMSPEQARGETVDRRTDIWSLGVLLYEMLTGQLPFKGDYESAILYSVMNVDAEPVTALRTGVPMELERIVLKALSKEPNERYQNVEDMLVDLRAVDTGDARASRANQPVTAQSARKHKKKIGIGIAALTVVLVTFFLTRSGSDDSASPNAPELQRLAVLPLSNMRPDPETDYLGYAVADQIIGTLANFKNLIVSPSSSIRRYEGRTVDLKSVGAELGVQFVLAGTYLRVADDVRVSLELIDVESDEIKWRDELEVRFENAFVLQDIVADSVLAGLQVQFSQAEHNRIKAEVPNDPEAYEYYLRARAQPSSIQSNQLAIELLAQSFQLDSLFAPAHVELGNRASWLAIINYEDIESNLILAEEAYQTALSLNPESISALVRLSALYTDLGKTEEAFEMAQKSLNINPNSADARGLLGWIYRQAGFNEEARTEMEKSIQLDPNNAGRAITIGITYYNLGDVERALDSFERMGEYSFPQSWAGFIKFVLGDHDAALKLLNRALELEPEGMFAAASSIYKSIIEGDTLSALNIFLEREAKNPPRGEAYYYDANDAIFFGYTEGALRALRRAVDLGYFNYPFMSTDPVLDPVRNEPEFQEILEDARVRHEAFKRRFMN